MEALPAFSAHILVAEDDLVSQMTVSQTLRLLGCRVDVASNGREAAGLAQAAVYDLILMDCMMPEMNGYEATREIRALPHYDGTPIIALTGNAQDGDRQKCLDAGMNDYLAKPVRKQVLADMLDKWLNPAHEQMVKT